MAIKEANHHIQGLVKRVHELEEQVKELSEELKKQNISHAENLKVLPLRMNQTLRQRDEEIQVLRKKLQSSDLVIQRLAEEARKKEVLLQHYKNRSSVLNEISKHREAFESILACLNVIEEPQTENRLENGSRETDLLDSSEGSDASDFNGNRLSTGAHGIDSGIATSYSSLGIVVNGETRQRISNRDGNCQEEVLLPSDDNPPPCFV